MCVCTCLFVCEVSDDVSLVDELGDELLELLAHLHTRHVMPRLRGVSQGWQAAVEQREMAHLRVGVGKHALHAGQQASSQPVERGLQALGARGQ